MSSFNITLQLLNSKTPSSISSFILAMTLYPDVQAKAQEEVDRVTGSIRLPTFSDRANMPYVNALVKEILRWNPAVPLGELIVTFHGHYTHLTAHFYMYNKASHIKLHRMTCIADTRFPKEPSSGQTFGTSVLCCLVFLFIFLLGLSCTTRRSFLIPKSSCQSDSSIKINHSRGFPIRPCWLSGLDEGFALACT